MGEQWCEWSLPSGLQKRIFTPVGGLGSGECLVDVNMDGLQDIVVTEGHGKRNLVWFEAPLWKKHLIDTEVEMPDCLAATLFGRKGFVMNQRGIPVRS